MIKVDSIKNYIAPRARLFRMEFKRSINEALEINRRDNVFKRLSSDMREISSNLKDSYTKGDVYTKDMSDNEAKSVLDSAKRGIRAYAKANDIDVIFRNPQKPYEYHSKDFENPLTVTVASQKGIFSDRKVSEKTIDGDINKVTKYITEKKVKSGDSFVTVPSKKDETFLRRVYRTVSELKNQIDAEYDFKLKNKKR